MRRGSRSTGSGGGRRGLGGGSFRHSRCCRSRRMWGRATAAAATTAEITPSSTRGTMTVAKGHMAKRVGARTSRDPVIATARSQPQAEGQSRARSHSWVRMQSSEFDAGIAGGGAPDDGCAAVVAGGLPSGNFVTHGVQSSVVLHHGFRGWPRMRTRSSARIREICGPDVPAADGSHGWTLIGAAGKELLQCSASVPAMSLRQE